MKKILFCMCISALVISCSKDYKKNVSTNDRANNINPKPQSAYDPQYDPWSDAQNPDNPYDSIGYHHNVALDNLFENVYTDIDLSDPEDSTVYYACLDYLDFAFGSAAAENTAQNYPLQTYLNLTADIPQNLNLYDLNYYDDEIDNLNISSDAKDALYNLFDVIMDTSNRTTVSYDYVKPDILAWEEDIIENSSNLYDANDTQILLTTSAVARYSILYWFNFELQYERSKNIGLAFNWRRFFGWLGVGGFDAMGALVGSIDGPLGSLLVGVAGSAAGWAYFRDQGWI